MNRVQEIIARIKRDPTENAFRLEIHDETGRAVGGFLPLNVNRSQDPEIQKLLSGWRQRFRRQFFSQGECTPETTARFLNESVMEDSGRLLFLIVLPDGTPVASEGICHADDRVCDLDYLMRGRMGGHPRLLYFAERRLLDWCFRELGLETVRCFITADNFLAGRFHEETGFLPRESPRLDAADRARRNLQPDQGFRYLEMDRARWQETVNPLK